MGNQLFYSKLNPVSLYEVSPLQQPQYMSRYSDDYRFIDTLRGYQTKTSYCQKWTTKDVIKLQFTTNFSPVQVQLVNCSDIAIITHNAIQKRANKFQTGFFIYEESMSLASADPGYYYLLVTLGNTKQMFSEPILISDYLAESLLYEYSNTSYHGEIIFETGFSPSFRIEGIIDEDTPSTIRTAYIDQQYNPSTLNAVPYQTATMTVGKDYGVPVWVAKKINWIFSCDNVSIDGKPWAVPESDKLDGPEVDKQYPMKSYSLKLQEGINRQSKIVGVDVDPNKRILMGLSVDSTIFGDVSSQAGNNIITIQQLG